MGDLIRRCDVLDNINKRIYYFDKASFDEAVKAVHNAPAVDEIPRWVSVKERLPEEGQIVAFIPSCNHGSVYVGVLTRVGKSGGVMFSHREGRYKSNYYAKYWMPLPELPKEKKAT